MPLLSRSLRSLLLLALPSSLSSFPLPSLCRTVSLPGSRPLTSNVLRWVWLRSYANVLLRRRPSSATVLDPPSPPPPPPPRPPPRLIHIHAVVIVCRLPAGGHYYTSCARSRHREATTPVTLLLSSSSSPVSPPPSSFLSLLRRGSSPRVSVNANPRFTTVSSNNLRMYHAVLAEGILYLFAARGSLQIISRVDFSSKRLMRKRKTSTESLWDQLRI